MVVSSVPSDSTMAPCGGIRAPKSLLGGRFRQAMSRKGSAVRRGERGFRVGHVDDERVCLASS